MKLCSLRPSVEDDGRKMTVKRDLLFQNFTTDSRLYLFEQRKDEAAASKRGPCGV